MPRSMVIVESPAKAKTIEKYLGKDYVVRASAGHIKDLPKTALSVNIKRDFHPTYRIIPGKEKIVQQLREAVQNAENVFLAADPDREGEAICQHLAEELNGTEKRRFYRVLLYEITENAILEAFKNPSTINRNKVEAQQARRILDRLVGYKVSPLLWQKIRRGLSAGRVQSVTLRLIVDREKKIRVFVPEEYWNFTARIRAHNPPLFEAKAVKQAGKKFKISNQKEANRLFEELRSADFVVVGIQKREKKRRPVPPFITSKLQQEASQKLRFSVKKTMSVAQRLYEGVKIGNEGLVGLITYLRTDSLRVANTALQEVREFIEKNHGKDYLPRKAVVYRGKKGAQGAHEAIRPTSVLRTPERIRDFLGRDEYRLYELVWKRFVASQMNPAIFDQTEIDIEAGRTNFNVIGKIVKFDGFLKLHQKDPVNVESKSSQLVPPRSGISDTVLPPVQVGEKLRVEEIRPEQKFTQPLPRYTEATLVKALEEKGIGRPSTYSQIISVIQDREYVEKEEGHFVPTEVGEVVIDSLMDHFEEIFNYDYTAKLEENLDEIESGREDWVHILREFYQGFSRELQQARQEMKNLKKEETLAGLQCEKCGKEMVIRWGRFGRFLACSAYPECKNTKKVVKVSGEIQVHQDTPAHGNCPKCGTTLVIKHGRYGQFVACSSYPECRYVHQESTGVICPDCGQGEVVQRKSRRKKVFYGCSTYPDCKFALWYRPIAQPCPTCGARYLLERSTKKSGLIHYCNSSECHYQEIVELVSV